MEGENEVVDVLTLMMARGRMKAGSLHTCLDVNLRRFDQLGANTQYSYEVKNT